MFFKKTILNSIDFFPVHINCIKLYFQPKDETHYFCYLHFLSLGTAQAATIFSTTNTNTANNYFGSATQSSSSVMSAATNRKEATLPITFNSSQRLYFP